MKIEKTECSYQVTECDLKFGEQITLDGELLISVAVLDKMRAEIETHKDCIPHGKTIFDDGYITGLEKAIDFIDEYRVRKRG